MIGSLAFAADDWSSTIERVLDSCVIIKMDRTRPFDGNSQSSSEASGFVVDAERGLVMTNRHVITTGPTLAHAIFNNQEEVDLVPVYADPVHDFGLFRYDPAELEFVEPLSLELAPEAAVVGAEIRVIGNDAAEQLSILSGTLSRLDRDAPYWDQNTFYLQAASSTSGGSSGSPVFNVAGQVVALNAGARNDAATSLFLPLERVQVALAAVQEGARPPRGTAQAVLEYRTWDELRRLGLTEAVEKERRQSWSGTGMLTVGRVNDDGPADGVLDEGDIVLSIGGVPAHTFVDWEAVLDGSIAETVAVEVLRGGERVAGKFTVQDLHGITPDAYLELGEGLVHDVGYMAATRAGRPMVGVQVARSGRLLSSAGVRKGSVITEIGGRRIRGLDDAVEAFASIPDGTRVPLRHSRMNTPEEDRVTTVIFERGIWPMRKCARGEEGAWPCEDLPAPPPATIEPIDPVWSEEGKKKLRAAWNSLVTVQFQPQLNLDSAHGGARTSAGVLLNAGGLILTDRHVLPVDTGQVRVRFPDTPSIPAQILYRDPVHNVALIRVDPELMNLPEPWEFPELIDELDLDDLTLVAMDTLKQRFQQRIDKPRSKPISLNAPRYPKYVTHNIDVVDLGKLDRGASGGVLVNKKGQVMGVASSYSWDEGNRLRYALYGASTRPARVAIDRWRRGVTEVPDLGLMVKAITMSNAREAGLPALHADRISAVHPLEPRVLRVKRIAGGAPAGQVLQNSDWLVAVDGVPLADFLTLEEAVLERGKVVLTIVRDLEELQVEVEPLQLPVRGTDRAILWGGVLVQEEHPEVGLFWQSPAAGVYLSWYYGGSPAHRYGTSYSRRLLEIDGVPVPDLDAFVEAVKGRADRAPVRLKLQSKNGKEWVTTLKLDLTWWPTLEFVRGDEGWERRPLE